MSVSGLHFDMYNVIHVLVIILSMGLKKKKPSPNAKDELKEKLKTALPCGLT